MEKRTSAFARIFAVLALVGAVLIVIVVISSSAGDGSGSSTNGHGSGQTAKKQRQPKTKAASYTVETGDTLTSIAHQTGVPVATILKLNPEVDPQILIAGEKLKLR
jgi:LysM repeat protein